MRESLKEWRSVEKALPDLLNWGSLFAAGVVANKDGSLMAAASFRGDDLNTASNYQREHVSAVLNSVMSSLGDSWMVHVEAVRVPARDYPKAVESHFPDEVSRLIDAERREMFGGGDFFTTDYVIFFTWLPPLVLESKMKSWLWDGADGDKETVQEQLIASFEQTVSSFLERLSAVVQVTRLEDDFFLTVLHRSLSGLHHPVRVPAAAMYLDGVIGGHPFWTGMMPRVQDKLVGVVAIDGFPSASFPQMLDALNGLGFEYRWSSRFIFMDTVGAVAALNKYRRKWMQKVRGFFSQIFRTQGVVDQDAVEMVGITDQALADANSGRVGYGYYTSVVLIYDDVYGDDRSSLQKKVKQVERVIRGCGFGARVEDVNAVEAFLGSLPGHGYENVRRPMISTGNLGDLLPSSAVWPGEQVAPCHFYPSHSPALLMAGTGGSTPFYLNLHVGDLGHTLMIGPTGSGKSTGLALIAAQFRRYKDAAVFAFDKGNSLLPLSLGVGGQHFEVSGESGSALHFAPLSRLRDEGWFAQIENWCLGLFELQNMTLSVAQKSELHRVLVQMKAGGGALTLSDLRIALQDMDMKQAIEPYTISGVCGELLDSAEDGLALSAWNCFEIEELMNRPDAVKLPVLLYLFLVIEKALKGQPALLILDEAWLMLGHPVFREKIREWLKVLRKANCAVIVATQSLSDAANSGILDVLTESCPTKIFLANAEAASEVNMPMYRNMGLSEAEISAIAGMTAKREYFIKNAQDGKRVVNFELGPVALAFCGVSDKEGIARIKELWHNKDSEFSFYWMRERGVNYEKYEAL